MFTKRLTGGGATRPNICGVLMDMLTPDFTACGLRGNLEKESGTVLCTDEERQTRSTNFDLLPRRRASPANANFQKNDKSLKDCRFSCVSRKKKHSSETGKHDSRMRTNGHRFLAALLPGLRVEAGRLATSLVICVHQRPSADELRLADTNSEGRISEGRITSAVIVRLTSNSSGNE